MDKMVFGSFMKFRDLRSKSTNKPISHQIVPTAQFTIPPEATHLAVRGNKLIYGRLYVQADEDILNIKTLPTSLQSENGTKFYFIPITPHATRVSFPQAKGKDAGPAVWHFAEPTEAA